MPKSLKKFLSLLLVTLAPLTVAVLITGFGVTFAQMSQISQMSSQPLSAKELFKTSYHSSNTFLSARKEAPITFTGLAVRWHQKLPPQTSAQILVRFFNQNVWSVWHPLEADIDGINEADYEFPSTFLPTNPAKTFQYKVVLKTKDPAKTPLVENLEFTYFNAGAGQKVQSPFENLIATLAPLISFMGDPIATPNQNLKIISRAEWGADESLRYYKDANPKPTYVKTENDFEDKFASELKIVRTVDTTDNGQKLTWPLQYPEKITKIIVHHTATTKDLSDPAQAIRNIYYWHAVTRGWGDIGYNYIIDQQGNIYEGRFGGDGVVGAHAGRGNIGSIGIAALGNYEDSEVPQQVLTSLVTLLRAKTRQYNIDPTGNSVFRGENLPNIMGHRDIMSTSCPGEKLYALLPALRLAVKAGFQSNIVDRGRNLAVNKKYDFSLVGDTPFSQFDPGASGEISLTVKNSGPTVWLKGTYFALNRSLNANTFFVTDEISKSQALDHDVQPGEEVLVKIPLKSSYTPGFAMIEIFPMIAGNTKVEKYLQLPVQIKQPVYDYEIQELNFAHPYLKKGMLTEVDLVLKNTGNITWKAGGKNRLTIGADKPRDHINKLLPKPGARLAELAETEVAPGQIGHFKIKLKAPEKQGLYQEYFSPVLEGVTWFANKNSQLEMFVYEKEFQAGLAEKDLLTNIDVQPGEKKKITFQLENDGGIVWNREGVNVPDLDVRTKNNFNLMGVAMQEDKVAPGHSGRIGFEIEAPEKIGTYYLRLAPKINGNTVLPRLLAFIFHVKNPASGTTTSAAPTTPANTPPTTPANTVTGNIRIDLAFRGDPVISADKDFVLQSDGKNLATFKKDEKVTVTHQQNKYQVKSTQNSFMLEAPPRFYGSGGGNNSGNNNSGSSSSSTSSSSSGNGAILRIENFDRRPSWNQNINDNQFRGTLEPRWYENELHVVNELPLEDYLKGLGEIRDSDPKEKIRTIIILARTYANFYMKVAEKFPGAPFNLSDDPETSQKYLGYSFEKRSPNTVQAVLDTLGLIVTYQGKLIKTPYFTSDDGRTRSAEEVWGWKDTPYLRSVADPYCRGKTLAGHGVGLSGCGSLGMAQTGKTYAEIIKYYFDGVDITKI